MMMMMMMMMMINQRKDICKHLDAQGLPDANQRYVIPVR
jgi:hypothetical protein